MWQCDCLCAIKYALFIAKVHLNAGESFTRPLRWWLLCAFISTWYYAFTTQIVTLICSSSSSSTTHSVVDSSTSTPTQQPSSTSRIRPTTHPSGKYERPVLTNCWLMLYFLEALAGILIDSLPLPFASSYGRPPYTDAMANGKENDGTFLWFLHNWNSNGCWNSYLLNCVCCWTDGDDGEFWMLNGVYNGWYVWLNIARMMDSV